MYATEIGRRLVKRANARDNQQRSPRTFFDDVFYPLVFGDDDYLMTPAQNSPPAQLISGRRRLKKKAEKEGRAWDKTERDRLRTEALTDLHRKAEATKQPFGNLVLGGYAKSIEKTTSGQVTGLDHTATAEDVYLSWIGAACGIGVAGGLVLLIDDDVVFDALQEGWDLYREVLRQTETLKSNQLETWNGQWLRHRFSANYRKDDPTSFLLSALKSDDASIDTVSWARLMFSLGRVLDGAPQAYVYSMGQMNTTIGFVPLRLNATRELREGYDSLRAFYRHLFGTAAVDTVEPDRLDEVYDAGPGFADACAQGAIGRQVFEPYKLSHFLPGRGDKQPKPFSPKNTQTYLLYQTWIYAMLGQQQALLDRATATAEMLLDFEESAIAKKTNLKKLVKDALDAGKPGVGKLPAFIDSLTDIAEKARDPSKSKLEEDELAEILNTLDELVRAVLDLSPEHFKLFLALLRFQVALFRGKAKAAA